MNKARAKNIGTEWPTFRQLPRLYAANPKTRLRASKRFLKRHSAQKFRWPYGCWGAANAWLVLLGPSPGGPHGGEKRKAGAKSRRWDQQPKIGVEIPIQFCERKQRNPRFKAVTKAGYGGRVPRALFWRLTALMNLDGGHATYGTQIDRIHLDRGCRLVFELMRKAKPRVVVMLSKSAWNPFSQFLLSRGAIALDCPPVYSSGKKLEALSFKLLRELDFTTLFVRSRQHPSMPDFKIGIDDRAIASTVRWFLSSQAKLRKS